MLLPTVGLNLADTQNYLGTSKILPCLENTTSEQWGTPRFDT